MPPALPPPGGHGFDPASVVSAGAFVEKAGEWTPGSSLVDAVVQSVDPISSIVVATWDNVGDIADLVVFVDDATGLVVYEKVHDGYAYLGVAALSNGGEDRIDCLNRTAIVVPQPE
jgi:hypothetical protein